MKKYTIYGLLLLSLTFPFYGSDGSGENREGPRLISNLTAAFLGMSVEDQQVRNEAIKERFASEGAERNAALKSSAVAMPNYHGQSEMRSPSVSREMDDMNDDYWTPAQQASKLSPYWSGSSARKSSVDPLSSSVGRLSSSAFMSQYQGDGGYSPDQEFDVASPNSTKAASWQDASGGSVSRNLQGEWNLGANSSTSTPPQFNLLIPVSSASAIPIQLEDEGEDPTFQFGPVTLQPTTAENQKILADIERDYGVTVKRFLDQDAGDGFQWEERTLQTAMHGAVKLICRMPKSKNKSQEKLAGALMTRLAQSPPPFFGDMCASAKASRDSRVGTQSDCLVTLAESNAGLVPGTPGLPSTKPEHVFAGHKIPNNTTQLTGNYLEDPNTGIISAVWRIFRGEQNVRKTFFPERWGNDSIQGFLDRTAQQVPVARDRDRGRKMFIDAQSGITSIRGDIGAGSVRMTEFPTRHVTAGELGQSNVSLFDEKNGQGSLVRQITVPSAEVMGTVVREGDLYMQDGQSEVFDIGRQFHRALTGDATNSRNLESADYTPILVTLATGVRNMLRGAIPQQVSSPKPGEPGYVAPGSQPLIKKKKSGGSGGGRNSGGDTSG